MYEPHEQSILRIDKDSEDLLYTITGGSQREISEWKGKNLMDFFLSLDVQQEHVKREIEMMKNKTKSKRSNHGE